MSHPIDINDTEALKALVEVEHTAHLWGQPSRITPRLVTKVFGDGQKLFFLTPILTRPNHYFIRVDSKWEDDGNEIRDALDDIEESIEDQFGSCCCEECCYGRDEEYVEADDEGFPSQCMGDGCSWGEESLESLIREREWQFASGDAIRPGKVMGA